MPTFLKGHNCLYSNKVCITVNTVQISYVNIDKNLVLLKGACWVYKEANGVGFHCSIGVRRGHFACMMIGYM